MRSILYTTTVISIKPLLARWVVAYIALSVVLSGMFMHAYAQATDQPSASTPKTLANQKTPKPRSKSFFSKIIQGEDNTVQPVITEIPASAQVAAAPAAPTAPAPPPAPAPPAPASAPQVQTAAEVRPASHSRNAYAAGNCTWYAKSRRPDLPNNLGNARTWFARARAQGIPTGSVPQAGAIGQQGNHVVYIERVNPNGTVLISEMNYTGFGKISHRTVAASSFNYIY
jgi:surface antigen